ncbi:alpha/beta fold hydrolase [Paenibacillus humicus]|uniref:alpha/beta fold hydrolase n=1 Tax=Paenibacillus humicus TaxID=412861 RepID=UPI003F1683AF
MHMSWIQSPSAWGTDIRCRWIRRDGSRSLAALFPGQGYSCEMPLLHYAGKSAMQEGYDLLLLEYGYQAARREPGPFEEAAAAASADSAAVLRPLLERYDRLAYIGKSVGTVVSSLARESLAEQSRGKEIRQIFLTPIAPAIPSMLRNGGLVAVGTADPVFGPEHMQRTAAGNGVRLLTIDGGDHGLELPDAGRSLEVLQEIVSAVGMYLKES